ncbi:MAG: hypothetical protein IJ335_06630 [Lachnospiraceae bacterium]|nr:hypothetical protein [Lachnospiraceae bacterium]
MKTIESMLKEEKIFLEKLVREAKKRLQTAPEGHFVLQKSVIVWNITIKNSDVCNPNGRYMKKSEVKLVRGIAQRDYDARTVKLAEERIKVITAFLTQYEITSLKKMYEELNQYRKELVSPFEISDDEYVKRWQEVKYTGKAFADDMAEIVTERGERVRSKSEKIIADKLYFMGVPYRYEYPLLLEDNIKLYPDFTILKMPEREEVYLEHFGLMDDYDYVENVMYKLNTYQKNGIFLGVNLFVTYENGKAPLNTKALDGLLRKLFCAEG